MLTSKKHHAKAITDILILEVYNRISTSNQNTLMMMIMDLLLVRTQNHITYGTFKFVKFILIFIFNYFYK